MRKIGGSGEPGLPGNTYIVVDEMENRLGKCWIEAHRRGEQIPNRSLEICLCMATTPNLDEKGRRQMLGTAFTRAMLFVNGQKENARIYAECAPNDTYTLELLSSMGLVDDEALLSMKRKTDNSVHLCAAPQGTVLICDRLMDEKERKFFVQRQEKLFGRQDAEKWTAEVCAKKGMKRMLLVSDRGLAAELVCWVENNCGVIGMVYTAPAWRRKGAAVYLMEAARKYFWQMRVPECRIEVRSRMLSVLRLAAKVGYAREKVLMRLPGINIDAPKPAVRKQQPKIDLELTEEERRQQEQIEKNIEKYRRLVGEEE
jgi:GNAT superfamily N-acetyltransferase